MGSANMDDFAFALKSNDAWASYKGHQNPAFFEKLGKGQSPSILWLGCSDSRVPETTLLGLQPGDVFVHRNIANIISPTDINSMAVLEYAVEHLKVKHIVLCGHTCCGGAAAALGDARVGGVIDAWITPLRSLRKTNEPELKAIEDSGARGVRLAELNVENGVNVLLSSFVVEQAVRDRGLKVHGVLYDVASGKIRDLGVGNAAAGISGGISPHDAPKDEKVEILQGNHGTIVFAAEGSKMAVR